MAKINSNQITFVDITDSRKLEIYINSNLPTTQIYNSNTKKYSPDWSGTNLKLNADVYLDSEKITPEKITWKIKNESNTLSSTSSLNVSTNVLTNNPFITYVCNVEHQNIIAFKEITFTRVDTGVDGTGVTILGSYDTLTQLQTAHPTGNAGDAYIVDGDLYVWSVDGAQWQNVGNIQGPAGADGRSAKNIILSGDSQVFKINKNNVITSSTITVTAQTFNTTVTNWFYSTNGGQTFLSTAPTGVSRNGNTVTITGSSLTSNSIVIKASDGEVEDVFTIYKAFDGTDGVKGNDGVPAPIAFLTNENITFSANTQGQISGTTITSNIVAYKGTTKVAPTIGTITGIPSGMTITPSVIAASNEIMLTITIANNSTLGSASNNMGVINIPITSPVSAVLSLTWSKVNAGIQGANGKDGVGINSTTVDYGVSDSATVQPTTWQKDIPVVAEGKYLWTRTITDYTDTSKPDTVTYVYAKQGTKGDTGSSGSSVTVSSIQYQAGSSATTAPTGAWSNNVVTVADGMYLWTKTTFSDNKVAYGVAKQGVKGDKGDTGRGVSKITEYYLATTAASGVTTATSGWTTTIQTVTSTNKYLWNYEIVAYTDGTTSPTTPVIIGVFGNTGATGKGIKSVTEYYLTTTLSSGVTISTSGWTTTMQTLTATNKYLWNYELITYTDDTTSTINPVMIGVYGDKGANGTNASLVDITPSAYYFKSTTGKDGTFTPEYIYVYPRFQTVTFSKWEYSVNGGTTWVAASGANGLAIGTYNSVANTLRIARTSTLYTDTVTSISFRCVSSNSAVYDTVSIAKIYDVVDLEIGGRNLLQQNNLRGHGCKFETVDETYNKVPTFKITAISDNIGNNFGFAITNPIEIISGTYTVSYWYKFTKFNAPVGMSGYVRVQYSDGTQESFNSIIVNQPTDTNNLNKWFKIEQTFTTNANKIATSIVNFYFYKDYALLDDSAIVTYPKIEVGNKATDWSPAPEDVDANIEKVDTRLTSSLADVKTTTDSISSKVSATEQSITTINGAISSLTTKVSAAEQKITSDAIVSTVRQSTDYINDLGKKVGTTEIISKINQTAENITISASKIGLLGATNIPDLTADKIKGGTLTLGGSSATTQSGQLLVKNASNVDMLKLNKDGIVVKSGHLAVASDFANSTYNWSTNTWTTTTNTSQLDLGDDYIRMGIYSPSGYTNYMRLLENGLHFQGNAQGIGSWGSFIGHDDYGDFVIQDTVRGYIVFKGPDDDTEIANISGSGLSVSGVYSNTIASSANLHINSSGQFYRSTSSSQKYKTDIKDIQSEELNPEKLYDLPVREFKFKEGYLSEEDRYVDISIPGFIAEEIAEIYPIACEYEDDEPESWNIKLIVPAMLKLIQNQKKEIEALKEQINNKAVN